MQRPVPENRLKELREQDERDLRLYDLAAHLRVEPSTIHRWEQGETAIPDWAKLELAKYFGVSPAYLMGWADHDQEPVTA